MGEEFQLRHGASEDELRAALQDALNGRTRMRIPPHADDTDLLLCGAIEELLEARAEAATLRARVREAEGHVRHIREYATDMEALHQHDGSEKDWGEIAETAADALAALTREDAP